MLKVAIIVDSELAKGKSYPKRVYYQAKSLVDVGYDVTIYCKNDKDMNLESSEIIDGIKIKRVFDFYLGTTTLIDKYLQSNIDLYNELDKKKYDVYHCHDTNTWPIGYIYSKKNSAKLICETHEYFPDYICKEWHEDIFKYEFTKILVKARGEYIRYADKVVCVSIPMAKQLKLDFELKEIPEVIYNTRPISIVDELDRLRKINLREIYNIKKEEKILLFQGLVEPSRGLDVAINIMKYIENAKLIIAGGDRAGYICELKTLAKRLEVEKNIIFTGYMPSEELLNYSNHADFLVYFGKNIVKNMELTIPNKFFDYIMVNKPIISSNLCSLKEIIEEHNIGIVLDIEKESFSDMAISINNLILDNQKQEIIKSNMNKLRENICWEKEELKLFKMYSELELNRG